jgi:hypothetical protein
MKRSYIGMIFALFTALIACDTTTKTPPKIISFTATPSSLSTAADVKLEWVVENATEISISPDIGVVSGTSKTVNVNSSKTFTLTAKNAQSSVSKDLTVQLTPSNQAVLFDTTKVADAPTRTALKSFDVASGELVFSQSTPTLEKLQVGDVIASEPSSVAENGYLRKIIGIQPDGTGFKVQSEPATLLEAIKQGEIHYDAPLEPSTLKSATPAMPGVRLIQTKAACLGYCYEAVLNAELCLTDACAEAKIKLEGSVKFSMGIKLDSKWSCCVPPLDWVEASFGVSEQANFKITGNLKGAVNKRIRIATYTFDPIIISLGIPLVFIPSVSVYVGVDVSASVNVEYGIKQSLGFRVGARWENKKGWSAIKDFTPTITQDPAPSLRGTAKVFTYAEVEPKISLYGIADIQAYLKVGPELEAGYPRNPLWNLRAKASGGFKFGVTIPIIDKEYKYDQELFNLSLDIAQAANESPVISSSPGNGVREPGTYSLLLNTAPSFTGAYDVINVNDSEDGVNLNFTANSSIDGDFTPVDGGLAKNLSPGLHTIAFKLTDSNGATVQGSFVVNVRLTPPTLVVTPSANTVQQGVGLPASALASFYDRNAGAEVSLPCANIAWSVTAPDVVKGTGGTESQTATGCNVVVRFLTQGSRAVSVTATGLTGGTTTNGFNTEVTAPPLVLPPLVGPITLLCAGVDPIVDNFTQLSKCLFSSVVDARVNASDPDGKALTYTWTMQPRENDGTLPVALFENLGVPIDGSYTSSITAPLKVGFIQRNPSWVFNTTNTCGAKFALVVSNGEASTSRSAELQCIIPPK